jgi:hypothetical protein
MLIYCTGGLETFYGATKTWADKEDAELLSVLEGHYITNKI